MKILHVISSIDPKWGGPSEGVRQQASVWLQFGAKVEVVCLDDPKEPYITTSTLNVTALGPSIGSYGLNTKIIPWLRENRSRFDVVIVNGIWGFHSLATRLALFRTSTPYVLFTHGMLDPWFKVQYPLKHAKKWFYWPWAEYRVLRDAAAVFFTCEEERMLASKSFWLYKCKEVVVRYGTAGPDRDLGKCVEEWLEAFPRLKGKRVALFVGRIAEKKGCDIAIRAFASTIGQSSDWQLVIAGPDTDGLRARLEVLAQQLGIEERITWAGTISGSLKWGAFASSEIFVLPSHQENFGIVVAEALACSLPVLISNKVNIWREVIGDGAGLAAPDNVEGAEKLFRAWSSMKEQERAEMKLRARLCFEERFEIHEVVADLIRKLSDVVSSAERRSANAEL